MKESFWGNYQTGHFFEIDEHERWIRRGGNAEKLGVPAEVVRQFDRYSDRETLFPFLWEHAPVMRWRCHGANVSFEFCSEDWRPPLELMKKMGYIIFRFVPSFPHGEFPGDGSPGNALEGFFEWHIRLRKNW